MAKHQFDCYVDTKEMAESIDTVKHHVDSTTGAVVAMQTAVVAAEKAGADNICRNVNRGFYSLIHSQISQKMAALRSEVDARLLRLNQQKKQLTAIKTRMNRDYNMICARYTKLFTALNRALKQRITELDRPIMNLVFTDASKVTNRHGLLTSDVPIGQSESIKLSQKIALSKVKRQTSDTIESMKTYLANSAKLEKLTDSILLNRRLENSEAALLVPVAVVQSNFDASGNEVTQTYISELPLSREAKNTIENSVKSAIRNRELEFVTTENGNAEMTDHFRMLVSSSDLDERKKRMMLDLFANSKF